MLKRPWIGANNAVAAIVLTAPFSWDAPYRHGSNAMRLKRWIGHPTSTLLTRFAICLVGMALGLSTSAPTWALDRPGAAFTIDQIMSAPFPSSLNASPDGTQVAWISNDHGARNIWIADKDKRGGLQSRPITAYSGDDGSDMGEVVWAPDGQTIIVTRGGTQGGYGPGANPSSLPGGAPEQQIIAVSLRGGPPKVIGAGHSATISPKGDLIAYVNNGQVWMASLSGALPPKQVIHEKGKAASLAWSPGGDLLAFISHRDEHSLVGVYDPGRKSLTWIGASTDNDRDPCWSPDGREIAFIRTPSDPFVEEARHGAFPQHREDSPWSILVGDPRTGEARTAWKADPGVGSAFQFSQSRQNLLWTADNHLIFPWERTGWLQLYAIPAVGGSPQLMTPGAFEIFDFSLVGDGDTIVFSSNQNDIDRRHIWETKPGQSSPQQLTTGSSIEDNPRGGSEGEIFALAADARKPLRAVMITDHGDLTDLSASIPTEFPQSKLIEPTDVVFSASDGLSVHAQLFLPTMKSAKPKPAVVFFHGGPKRQMLLGWNPIEPYAYMYGMNQYLASEGYIVLSVNYRGGVGYGLDFREPANFGAGGASEVNDIIGAANYLRGRHDVDPARIALWGGSYGGLMVNLGLARASNLFVAGVDYAGMSDWTSYIAPTLSSPGAPPGAVQRAFESSPIATLSQWRSPVLIVHADDDRNVEITQTVELVAGLRKQGVAFQQLTMADEIHDLLRHRSWLKFFSETDNFLARYLR